MLCVVHRDEEEEGDEEDDAAFSYPLLSSRSLPATPLSAYHDSTTGLGRANTAGVAAAGAVPVAGGLGRPQRAQGSARSYVLDVGR